jgi:hypothetical protein
MSGYISDTSKQLSVQTETELSTISENGYGSEFNRIAKFINKNFGGNIKESISILGGNVTMLYGSLFKIVCGRTDFDENIENSQDSQISEITIEDSSCKLLSDDEIKGNIQHAMANTLLNDIDSSDEIVKQVAQSLLQLKFGDEGEREFTGGKKKKYKNKTNKKYKYKSKKRRTIKRKKSQRRK